MSTLRQPSILTDLGSAGEDGLPLDPSPLFRQQLELCRRWGFQFNIGGGRVSLRYDQEQLVPAWIQKETPSMAWERLEVIGFLSVESTNSEAVDLARQGAPGGTLIYAEEQTAGKGRKDRPWFSPAGSGLYFSLVLRPEQPRKAWPLLTHAASVALVESLKGLFDQNDFLSA
jgi:BirA family biotin operon repressor/biotin-[acetyl-CoA-carboxylase] ligase